MELDEAPTGTELTEEFFHGKVTNIAEELIGKLLVHETEEGTAGGIIVETEAYLGREDPASHLVNAGEKRRKVFEKGSGTVYVFKIYHHCNLNFITEYNRIPEGVLVRALEPTRGIELMKERRGVEDRKELASGPGKLTGALGVTREETGTPVEESNVSLYETGLEPEVEKTGRIGISDAEDWPLRFIIEDSEYISTTRNPATAERFDIRDYYK